MDPGEHRHTKGQSPSSIPAQVSVWAQFCGQVGLLAGPGLGIFGAINSSPGELGILDPKETHAVDDYRCRGIVCRFMVVLYRECCQ